MYLLDTNTCIALINGKPAPVRAHFQRAVAANQKLSVSSIAAFELWYGVAKSTRIQANTQALEAFFAGTLTLLSFEPQDAKAAGQIRAALEASGKPVGSYDLLIAGQALRNELTLVTANVREFSRIKGLKWEDWAKA
jgi:tRNA(fMet)-specific endonuclease VapC